MTPSVITLLTAASLAGAGDASQFGRAEQAKVFAAPEPPPPALAPRVRTQPRILSTLYSIGEPTDAEQLYLEYINRARANPAAEGVRLAAARDPWILSAYEQYSLNLTLLESEFAALPPQPPLAMNEKLLQAARAHTQDQLNRAVQTHTGANGQTVPQRIVAAGYPGGQTAENCYAYSVGEWFGHAGLNVDWGPGGSGGMQAGRKHRASIHSGAYREIGIGVVFGTNTVSGNTVGPQLVTQNFSVLALNAVPLVTGVAYYDLNSNAFYDPGEGIGGIRVTVEGSSFHAVTAASGGYAVPVPLGDGPRAVFFSGDGFEASAQAVITGGGNAKVDFTPDYPEPVLTGPVAPGTGTAATYRWPDVPGADSYEWRCVPRTPAADDPADSLAGVVTDVAGFSPLSTTVKQSGSSAYRLIHPTARDNFIRYPHAFMAGPAAALRFFSRLRYSALTEVARVQISTDGGALWTDVYTQKGSDTAGESAFTDRLVSLAPFAGKEFHLRFAYTVSESYYNSTGSSVGWYIDNIRFMDLLDTTAGVTSPTDMNAADFTAPADGHYLLSARPLIGGRRFPFGPAHAVTAAARPTMDYADWSTREETAAGLPAGALADPAADHNRDGIPNLAAYLMGAGPTRAGALPPPVPSPQLVIFEYPRNTAATQGILIPEISSDLSAWFAPGDSGAPAGFTDAALSTLGTIETRRASTPAVPGVSYFFRLRATTP